MTYNSTKLYDKKYGYCLNCNDLKNVCIMCNNINNKHKNIIKTYQ